MATMTLAEFEVDLAQLHDAIGTVQKAKDRIDVDATTVSGLLTDLEGIWSSPAGTTFSNLVTRVTADMGNLSTILGDMIKRLNVAYGNYLDTEQTVTHNVK